MIERALPEEEVLVNLKSKMDEKGGECELRTSGLCEDQVPTALFPCHSRHFFLQSFYVSAAFAIYWQKLITLSKRRAKQTLPTAYGKNTNVCLKDVRNENVKNFHL